MKRLLLLGLVFLAYTNIVAQSGWTSHSELTTHTLRGASALYLAAYSGHLEELKRYVIVGDSGTVITHGANGIWNVQLIDPSTNLNSVTYYSPESLYAAGEGGKFYRSNDSGYSWSGRTAIGGIQGNIRCISMISMYLVYNSKLMWMCGDSGLYLRSIDRGYTFSKITTNRPENLNFIYPVDIVNQYVFGDSCIMRSTNGGKTFETLILPSKVEHENFYSGYFSSINDGICFGTNGTILSTTTRGAVWVPETSHVRVTLRASCFVGSGVGYVVGDSGVILKTRDGGSTWRQLLSGTTNNLYGVAFLNEKEGIVIGENGTLLETTNGGEDNPVLVTYLDRIDLGSVLLGTSKQFTIPLYSKGPHDLISGPVLVPNSDFSCTGLPVVLHPEERGILTFTYTPSSEGMLNSSIAVFNNTADSVYALPFTAQSAKGSQSSDWTWQNPSPTGSMITDVSFIDDSTVAAVGSKGQFLISTDAGNTWSGRSTIGGTTNTLVNVWFKNADTGFATGYGGTIVQTTDGGDHWFLIETASTSIITDISYPRPGYGFAIGYFFNSTQAKAFSTLSKTTGSNGLWEEEFSYDRYLRSSYFIDADTGFIVMQSDTLKRTTDGGHTWLEIDLDLSCTLYKMTFLSKDTGFCVGSGGTILKTVNAGREWAPLNTGVTATFTDIAFQNSLEGIAVASNGLVAVTSDGGASWQSTQISNFSPRSCTFRNNIGYISGTDYDAINANTYFMYRSTDKGTTWVKQTIRYIALQRLQSVAMIDQNITVAVGDSGIVLRSEDAGRTWSKPLAGTVINNSNISLKSVSFSGQLVGMVVGSAGTILRTTDAGEHWQVKSASTIDTLFDVSCVTNLTGFIVGDFGLILKTTDGGDNWNSIGGITSNKLSSVYTLGENSLCVVGVDGFFGKSTNNGQTWTTAYLASSLSLNDVYFFDDAHGIVIGDGGRIFRTTDGGHLWAELSSGTNQSLYSIYFANTQTGFVSGDKGVVLYTTDGGQSWSVQGTSCPYPLYAISGSDSYHLTAVGLYGVILRTNTGGVLSVPSSSATNMPARFTLEQNYPNPFNPVTTIRFSIPETRTVTLKVYDLLGREIARLVDERLTPGSYTISWDANNVTSGIYFYRLTAGDYSEVKKMLYLR